MPSVKIFTAEQIEELKDLIKSINKRCIISNILIDNPVWWYLLPTILEDLAEDAQVILKYCIQEEEKNGKGKMLDNSGYLHYRTDGL